VEPSREALRRENLVESILTTGWDAVNLAIKGKYGKDLSSAMDPTERETYLRHRIARFYAAVDPSRPVETHQVVIDMIQKEGFEPVNQRMQAKYGRDLDSFSSPATGAPTSESAMVPMALIGGAPSIANVTSTLEFKVYHVQVNQLGALCTCGAWDPLVVTETSTNNTIRFAFGCTEMACYSNNTHIGRFCQDYAGDGTWIRVPTLKDQNGMVMARCYLARSTDTPCCSPAEIFYLLEIVGYQTLKCPREAFNCGSFTFYDQFGKVAIECQAGLCTPPIIRARADIPHYAVALIPLMNSNQQRSG